MESLKIPNGLSDVQTMHWQKKKGQKYKRGEKHYTEN